MVEEKINTMDYDVLKIFLSAFAGAFSAFIFTKLASYFAKKAEKRNKHK